MALDESVDNLEKMESNGVEVYIDPGLKEFLTQFESINVDYVDLGPRGSGFTVSAGKGGGCGSEGGDCSSCG